MTEPARQTPADTEHPIPVEYGAESIRVLKGLDAVRKRPGMYIGDTDDGSGQNTWCTKSSTTQSTKRSPVMPPRSKGAQCRRLDGARRRSRHSGRHSQGRRHSAAEVIMTQLHAGGKIDQNSTRSPAVCTGRRSAWSTRCRASCSLGLARRQQGITSNSPMGRGRPATSSATPKASAAPR